MQKKATYIDNSIIEKTKIIQRSFCMRIIFADDVISIHVQ